mgnify:CR=1 FL=1
MPKKYIALADMSIAMSVEFDETEIPAGWSAYEYAQHLGEKGEFVEEFYGGEFRITDVMENDE